MTLTLTDLGLMPRALAELEAADKTLVDAWLAAASTQIGLRSPGGWVVAGVRSGVPPATTDDAAKRQATHLAERFITNAGHIIPSENELLDELFGNHGRLRYWDNDQTLRTQMLERWRRTQPATTAQ